MKWLAVAWVSVSLIASACTSNQAEKHYILAEKLWESGNFGEAVSEFEKAFQKNPKTRLGSQALYRAALTQTLYLKQHAQAIENLRQYIALNPTADLSWSARKEIANIVFERQKKYREAIRVYEDLIRENSSAKSAEDHAEFLFRAGKSHYYLFEFKEAIQRYQELIRLFPDSEVSEKAQFEIGTAFFTEGREANRGEKEDSYTRAISAYREFIEKYPKNPKIPEAQFGIAASFEEMDHLEEAYQQYQNLTSTYPSPKVIQIKLVRIRDRIAQKSRK